MYETLCQFLFYLVVCDIYPSMCKAKLMFWGGMIPRTWGDKSEKLEKLDISDGLTHENQRNLLNFKKQSSSFEFILSWTLT